MAEETLWTNKPPTPEVWHWTRHPAMPGPVTAVKWTAEDCDESWAGTGFEHSVSPIPSPEELTELRALVSRVGELEGAAREVLAKADKSVSVARLSDDDLAWICPECHDPKAHYSAEDDAPPCRPDCTRSALLGALDAMDALLASGGAQGERKGEDHGH